jgi:hypothetical protein
MTGTELVAMAVMASTCRWTIGTVPTSAEAPYWNAFVKKAGIDVSGTKMVQMS